MDGLDAGTEPPSKLPGNAYDESITNRGKSPPASLSDALRQFGTSEFAARAPGNRCVTIWPTLNARRLPGSGMISRRWNAERFYKRSPFAKTDFTKETGIKVIYDVFDSNEILETKLLTGGTGYDVVVPSGTFLARQIQAGVFQPPDMSKLPNAKNLWPEIQKRTDAYDPGQKYSINYMWGTTGIGYNVKAAKERIGGEITSWDVVFDPKKLALFKDCGIHIFDAPAEIIPAALNYLGKNPDSKDADELREGAALLQSIRSSVQKFHSSEYINALANGDICLTVGWSGDKVWLAMRPEKMSISLDEPKQGNCLAGEVWDRPYLGDLTIYKVKLDTGEFARVSVLNRSPSDTGAITLEDRVWLSVEPDAALVLAE